VPRHRSEFRDLTACLIGDWFNPDCPLVEHGFSLQRFSPILRKFFCDAFSRQVSCLVNDIDQRQLEAFSPACHVVRVIMSLIFKICICINSKCGQIMRAAAADQPAPVQLGHTGGPLQHPHYDEGMAVVTRSFYAKTPDLAVWLRNMPLSCLRLWFNTGKMMQ